MAIKNIPNQPIQFDIPIYETCEDERLNCALYKQNDGLIYSQFELNPCYSDIELPFIADDGTWNFVSANKYNHNPTLAGSLQFAADFGSYGNYFKITFRFTGITDGNCQVNFATLPIATITENGTYSLYSYYTPVAPPTDYIEFYGSLGFDGTVEMISVDAFYIPTNWSEWISVYTFKDEIYSIAEECIDVTLNQNRVNLGIDPSCFDPNCYYLKVCEPCAGVSPTLDYVSDFSNGWTDIDNCNYAGCDYPANTILYGSSLRVETSGNVGNKIELYFTSPSFTLTNPNCCHIIKFNFGVVEAMTVSITTGKTNCEQTFIPTDNGSFSFICCDILEQLEFNLIIEETEETIKLFEIASIEIYETIACSDNTGLCKNSNCFQILAFNDTSDTKLITADCNDGSYQLGFFWDANFKLKQRIPTYRFAPTYLNDANDYIFSDGSRKITSAQRMKMYDIVFGDLEEYQHDALSTQILCKTFLIDGEEYFVQPDDYKPEWTKNIGYPRADVRMLAMKQGTIIFRENQN